jgi:hypothetical protein
VAVTRGASTALASDAEPLQTPRNNELSTAARLAHRSCIWVPVEQICAVLSARGRGRAGPAPDDRPPGARPATASGEVAGAVAPLLPAALFMFPGVGHGGCLPLTLKPRPARAQAEQFSTPLNADRPAQRPAVRCAGRGKRSWCRADAAHRTLSPLAYKAASAAGARLSVDRAP